MGLCNEYQTESKFFKNTDIIGIQKTLTITGISEETFDDGRKQPTLKFSETPKILGLNKTNRDKLAELFGQPDPLTGTLDVEPSELIGKQICVYRAKTQDKSGATVDCVRVRAVQPLRFPQSAPVAPFQTKTTPGGQSARKVTIEEAGAAVLASCGGDKEKARLKWFELVKVHNVNYAAFLEECKADPTNVDLSISEEKIPF